MYETDGPGPLEEAVAYALDELVPGCALFVRKAAEANPELREVVGKLLASLPGGSVVDDVALIPAFRRTDAYALGWVLVGAAVSPDRTRAVIRMVFPEVDT
jgi:hypothetical protein